MENTAFDRETVVPEESMEAAGDYSNPDPSADLEGQPGPAGDSDNRAEMGDGVNVPEDSVVPEAPVLSDETGVLEDLSVPDAPAGSEAPAAEGEEEGEALLEDGEAAPEGEITDDAGTAETAPSLPEYTLESPLPVMVVEPEEEEYEIPVTMSLTSGYPGTISDAYLEYFAGIAQKLKWNEHYVVYRSGQYSYTMAYGEEISLEGSRFAGTGNVVTIYRDSSSSSSNYYVSRTSDSVSLSAGTLFVYSDLGMFPSLVKGVSRYEGMALLFAFCVAFLTAVLTGLFRAVGYRFIRR